LTIHQMFSLTDSLFEGLAAGEYTIVMEDIDNCRATTTASIIPEDYSFPLVDTIYILNGNPETVVLPSGANYEWFPMIGLECNDNCSVVEILVEEETVYTVTATTIDGCEATEELTVIPILLYRILSRRMVTGITKPSSCRELMSFRKMNFQSSTAGESVSIMLNLTPMPTHGTAK